MPRISLLAPSPSLVKTDQSAAGTRTQSRTTPGPGSHSQRAGRQVGVFVLEFSVQGETSLVSVVGQKRCDGEHFAEGGTGRNHITEDTVWG